MIAPGLILTAAHVVLPQDDSVVEEHGLIEVRDMAGALAAAEIIWHDADLDAALLSTDRTVGAGTGSIRWGELVCDYRARRAAGTMAGFPQGMNWADGSPSSVNDLKVVDGHIKSVSGSRSGTYVFEVEDAVPAQAEEWQGLSGAGVFCNGVLVGIVLSVPPGWGDRILTVLPVNRLLSANSFVDVVGRHTDDVPRLQAADLTAVFTNAPPPQLSSSFLLHPRSRVVPLSGMERLLDSMRAWCDNTEHSVGVALVTGRGGTGKNRLVPELLDRLTPHWSGPVANRRWHGGFLSRRPHRAEYEILTAADHPLLIAVDQAETRLDRVGELLDTLVERPSGSPIRVLLIARDMDTWWPQLQRRCSAAHGLPVATFSVDAFDALEAGAEEAYVNGKIAFAQRIRHLREAGHGDHTWKNAAIADAPRTHGSGVEDRRPAPVVHLHVAALADVLTHANPDYAREHNPLDVLLAHDEGYWHRIATAHMPGSQYTHDQMRTMISAQYLVGATTDKHAAAAVAAAYDAHHQNYPATGPPTARELDAYNRSLTAAYPSDDGSHWGAIGPDILAARLVAEVEKKRNFLEHLLLNRALVDEQRERALTNIVRATETYPELAAGARRAVAADPQLLLGAAVKASCAALDRTKAQEWLHDLGVTIAEQVREAVGELAEHQRAARIIEQVLDRLRRGVTDIRVLTSIDDPLTTRKSASITRGDEGPASREAVAGPNDGAQYDNVDRKTEPSQDAPPDHLVRSGLPQRRTTVVRAPGGHIARLVTSTLALTHLTLLSWAASDLARSGHPSDPTAWLLPPATILSNLVIGILFGYLRHPPSVATWSAPFVVLILNICSGISFVQSHTHRGPIPAGLIWGSVTALGTVSVIYAIRAWTGQVSWHYTDERTT